MPGETDAKVVRTRLFDATLAELGSRIIAALTNHLARAPAARLVPIDRLRALEPAFGEAPPAEVSILLGVAVPGKHLDQALKLCIVELGAELLVPGVADRRVEAPRRAVRNHQRVEPPFVELLEQRVRARRALTAGQRELPAVDAFGAHRITSVLADVPGEIEIGLLVGERARGNRQERPERAELRKRAIGDAGRRDRPGGKLVVGVVFEEHVLVAEVLFGRQADLRPLESGERDDVRLLALGDRVALPNRLPRHLPRAWIERLGVVGQRVEIELRAEAGEVTRVGRGMHPFASHQGEAPHEGVHGQGRVDVQVAE